MKTKMRVKILVPILIILLLSFSIMFLVIHRSSKTAISEQIKLELQALTHSYKLSVEDKNELELRTLEIIVRNGDIEDPDVSLFDKHHFVTYILERCEQVYYDMVLVDKKGYGYEYEAENEEDIHDYSSKLCVQQALKGVYYSGPTYRDQNSKGETVLKVDYAYPVRDPDDNIIGAIYSTIKGSELCDMASEINISENAEIFLLDRSTGNLLAANDIEKVISGETNFLRISNNAEGDVKEAFKSLFAGDKGCFVGSIRGTETIMAYETIEGLPWSVLVFAPYSDFHKYVIALEKSVGKVIFLSLLLTLIVGYIVVCKIIAPLAKVKSAVEDLSSGNADLTKKLKSTTRDEIHDIVVGINTFTDKLGGIVGKIKNSKDTLSEAGQYLGDISSDTSDSIKQIVNNIEDVNSQIMKQTESVSQTAGAVNEIASNIESLERMIDTQTAGVTEASAAVEEMIGNIASVNQSVEKMAESFLVLEQNAQNGSAKQEGVNEKIAKIEEQSKTLLDANTVIASIAEQTNLLAMNAAIEAAHAGEAGKGFSVVADEIRKLSETSTEQSKTIGDQLSKIQKLIEDVVAASNESSEAFNTVASKIQETDELVRQIKSAMDEQQEGSKQIGTALHAMNDSTLEVKSASSEMSEGNKAILDEVRMLQDATLTMRKSVDVMSDSARKVSETESALMAIVDNMNNSINTIGTEIDQFKV